MRLWLILCATQGVNTPQPLDQTDLNICSGLLLKASGSGICEVEVDWLRLLGGHPRGWGQAPIPCGHLPSHSFWCLLGPSRLQKCVFSCEIHIPSSKTPNRANDIWILIVSMSPSHWCSPINHLRYFYSMISLPLALFLCNPYKT